MGKVGVILLPYLYLTLLLFSRPVPGAGAKSRPLGFSSNWDTRGPGEMSHRSGRIYFQLTFFCPRVRLAPVRRRFYEGREKLKKKRKKKENLMPQRHNGNE